MDGIAAEDVETKNGSPSQNIETGGTSTISMSKNRIECWARKSREERAGIDEGRP
jgi:hypothetical protein